VTSWKVDVMFWITLCTVALAAQAAKLGEVAVSFPYVSDCPQDYELYTYPHPDSCHSFYKCENGTLTEELCEHGLLFDGHGNIHNHCNYHWGVNCQGRYSDVVAHESGPCEFDYSQQRGPGYCEKYYIKCSGGVPKDVPCTEGLAYDNRTRSCNWPDLMLDFECVPEQIVGFKCPAEIDPASLTARFIPFPRFPSDDPGSYIVCVDGSPRRLFCGGDSIFDEATLTCY